LEGGGNQTLGGEKVGTRLENERRWWPELPAYKREGSGNGRSGKNQSGRRGPRDKKEKGF